MKTQSKDTSTQVELVQISLLREQSVAKKIAHICSLSQTTMQLSKRAIARANPNLNNHQINLLFIKYQYGIDLASRVEDYLKNKKHAI
jgi:hypothetical protein